MKYPPICKVKCKQKTEIREVKYEISSNLQGQVQTENKKSENREVNYEIFSNLQGQVQTSTVFIRSLPKLQNFLSAVILTVRLLLIFATYQIIYTKSKTDLFQSFVKF